MPFLEGKSQTVSDCKKKIYEDTTEQAKGTKEGETLEEAEKGGTLNSIAFVPL
jgi:hypothetical protein